MSLIAIRTKRVSEARKLIGGDVQAVYSHALSRALLAYGGSASKPRVLRWLDPSSFLVVPPDRISLLSEELEDFRNVRLAKLVSTTGVALPSPVVEIAALQDFVDTASLRGEYVLLNPGIVP
jgi:hypothetical protein